MKRIKSCNTKERKTVFTYLINVAKQSETNLCVAHLIRNCFYKNLVKIRHLHKLKDARKNSLIWQWKRHGKATGMCLLKYSKLKVGNYSIFAHRSY